MVDALGCTRCALGLARRQTPDVRALRACRSEAASVDASRSSICAVCSLLEAFCARCHRCCGVQAGMQRRAGCACRCPLPLLRHAPGPGCDSVRCGSGAAMWIAHSGRATVNWCLPGSRVHLKSARRLLSSRKHFENVLCEQGLLQACNKRQEHVKLAMHCTWGRTAWKVWHCRCSCALQL